MEKILHVTETEYKLREAKYFLTLLSQKSKKGEEFDFLLNAFVNSARSILWVMRAEFSKIIGWGHWFKQKRIAATEENIFHLFNDLRVSSTKIESLRTHFLVDLKIPKGSITRIQQYRLKKLRGKKLKITIRDNKGKKPLELPNRITFSAYLAGMRRGIVGFTDKDILVLCKRYIAILEEIVNECLVKFGKLILLNKKKSTSHHLTKVYY